MTFKEICDSEKIYLTAADIQDVLEADPSSIRYQAQRNPLLLGFPVIIIGNRVKIPREGFIHFMKYGHSIIERRENEKP